MNRLTLAVLGTFVALLVASGTVAYLLRERGDLGNVATHTQNGPESNIPFLPPPSPDGTKQSKSSPDASPEGTHTLLGELFGERSPSLAPSNLASWEVVAARVALRFSLAAFLAALLAFRPRRGVSVSRRNPYVAQTQILMAVVAGAMMMVVGDSAARAFGIFAAASLVRFRTNIRDPKEITVLLVCLGVGLAAGVGRWDMAIILSLFVLLALAILEYFEESQVFRSMQVSVATKNTETTHEVLKRMFRKYRFDAELREINHPDEDKPMGKIVYLLNIKPKTSTDRLSEEIISGDKDNIDSVEWEQKESQTYIYK